MPIYKTPLHEMRTTSLVFDKAMTEAESLTTDELLSELAKVEYKAFGFPGVMLWKMLTLDDKWQCGLRNDQQWEEEKPEFQGATPHAALSILFAWCIYKNYLLDYKFKFNQ